MRKRVVLELGGKSASLVLDDADLETAVKQTLKSAFNNAGQMCGAWTRLVVPRSRVKLAVELAVSGVAELNGHFVIDERTDLPEGTEVELQLVKVADAFADMAPEDREELEEAIEEGFRDFEDGDHISAREFLAQLRAKNA